MREVQRYLLIWWAGSCVLLGGLSVSLAEDQDASSAPIEVIINNKQYKSIHAYKCEQIRRTLKRALSSYNLREFSEDELYAIMKEVRKQQTTNSSVERDSKSADQSAEKLLKGPEEVEEDAQDLRALQMQEMLKEYRQEHKGAGHLFLDPDKVKSIIIKPAEE